MSPLEYPFNQVWSDTISGLHRRTPSTPAIASTRIVSGILPTTWGEISFFQLNAFFNAITMKYKTKLSILLGAALLIVVSCTEDIPKKEDVPELITRATLTFTPQGGGDVVIVSATDPDGDGIHPIVIDGDIRLAANKTYALT